MEKHDYRYTMQALGYLSHVSALDADMVGRLKAEVARIEKGKDAEAKTKRNSKKSTRGAAK